MTTVERKRRDSLRHKYRPKNLLEKLPPNYLSLDKKKFNLLPQSVTTMPPPQKVLLHPLLHHPTQEILLTLTFLEENLKAHHQFSNLHSLLNQFSLLCKHRILFLLNLSPQFNNLQFNNLQFSSLLSNSLPSSSNLQFNPKTILNQLNSSLIHMGKILFNSLMVSNNICNLQLLLKISLDSILLLSKIMDIQINSKGIKISRDTISTSILCTLRQLQWRPSINSNSRDL